MKVHSTFGIMHLKIIKFKINTDILITAAKSLPRCDG